MHKLLETYILLSEKTSNILIMTPNDFKLQDINLGDTVSFNRTWDASDIEIFAELSGDMNPLHMDDEYAKTTKFGKRVVHGMLVGSLCSKLVGMYLPGKRCLYLTQSLSFKKPVYIRDTVMVTGTVTSKSEVTGVLSIAITITRENDSLIEGEAQVQVLP